MNITLLFAYYCSKSVYIECGSIDWYLINHVARSSLHSSRHCSKSTNNADE